MLDKKQFESAVQYNENSGAVGDKLLPWPWGSLGILGSGEFTLWTAIFQADNGLACDGKLGPVTRSAIFGEKSVQIEVAKTVSNAVVINGESVPVPDSFLDAGIETTNYIDDDEPHFRVRKKKNRKLGYFVLHETCGNTADGCKRTLLKKGSGVQLILSPDGNLSCHGDLLTERMVHANQLNSYSVGIEVVNPYNPVFVSDERVFNEYIGKKWWTWIPSKKSVKRILDRKGMKSVPKQYVLPTDKQMRALEIIVPWVCDKVGIPYVFPTLGKKKKVRYPDRGVVAHKNFNTHSDGIYLLEHLARTK